MGQDRTRSRIRASRFGSRDALWIGCGDRSDTSILGELADQLGTNDTRTIRELLARHRLLLVLDDVRGSMPLLIPERHHSSILLTTRSSALDVPHRMRLSPANVSRDLCDPTHPITLALWQAMSVCAPQGFPTSLPASMIGIQASEAQGHYRSLDRKSPGRLTRWHAGATERAIGDSEPSKQQTLRVSAANTRLPRRPTQITLQTAKI